MYGSAFYKLGARKRLRGNYLPAVIASLICLIPGFILTSSSLLLSRYAFGILVPVMTVLFNVFITNIFDVGYTRFLMKMPADDEDTEAPSVSDRKKPDYNTLLSGYTMNFSNTLKIMVVRDLYRFLWSLLMLVPIVIYIGIMAFLMSTAIPYAQLANYLSMLAVSPSSQMLNLIIGHIIGSCPLFIMLSLLMLLGILFCAAISIRKSYEYAVIPMIIADEPDIPIRRAFKLTRDIMTGFRMRLFLLQLSFIGYLFLLSAVMVIAPVKPAFYIAVAALNPYMQMSYIQFYTERRGVIDYNISTYGEQD